MFTSVSEFFFTVTGDIVIGAVCFLLGMALKTKVTDWAKGVPSDVRTALDSVEADAVSKLKAVKAPAKKASPAAAALVASSAAAVSGAAPVAAAPTATV